MDTTIIEISADEFKPFVVEQTTSSVTFSWPLIPNANSYKIEQHDKRLGWRKVAWTTDTSAKIDQLDDNFGYKFRILAMRFSPDKEEYISIGISNEFVGCTLPSLPSTMCFYRAIKKSQQFLVKRLLLKRPDLISLPAQNGYLPLANAIAMGEIDVVDVLLSAGANVHVGNITNKRTPLHLAFYHGHLSIARILINKKADINVRDCVDMTPSHYAIDGDQYNLIKFAVESGCEMEAKDSIGYTLLLRAIVMKCNIAIVKFLVTHGADLSARNKNGLAYIELAKLYDNFEASHYIDNFKKKNVKNVA